MTNVVSIFDALPPRVVDRRLDILRRKFGFTRPFTAAQAADALSMDAFAFRMEFTHEPFLEDDVCRLNPHSGGMFYLASVPPARAALPHWRRKYLPAMRRKLLSRFSIQNVADVIQVPYPSAAFLVSQFVAAGIILANDEKFEFKPRRVIMNAPRRRVRWDDQPVYQGY